MKTAPQLTSHSNCAQDSMRSWPRADEVAQWWADRAMTPPTPEQLEAMREEYERECIADAQSAADYAANLKEFSK